jgi:hypothetical protein
MLLIDNDVAARMRAAHDKARSKPVTFEEMQKHIVPDQGVDVITLANRAPGMGPHDRPPSITIEVPVGYRMAVSYEVQPAGLIAHFSFSVDAVGALPNVESVRIMLAVVGFDFDDADMIWREEFLLNDVPGGVAVNILFVVDPNAVGHT